MKPAIATAFSEEYNKLAARSEPSDKIAGIGSVVAAGARKLPGAIEGVGKTLAHAGTRAANAISPTAGGTALGLYQRAAGSVGGAKNLHTALGATAIGGGLLAGGAAAHKLTS
jgi:hypothetical protein